VLVKTTAYFMALPWC